MISRRGFLGGVAALVAAPGVPFGEPFQIEPNDIANLTLDAVYPRQLDDILSQWNDMLYSDNPVTFRGSIGRLETITIRD